MYNTLSQFFIIKRILPMSFFTYINFHFEIEQNAIAMTSEFLRASKYNSRMSFIHLLRLEIFKSYDWSFENAKSSLTNCTVVYFSRRFLRSRESHFSFTGWNDTGFWEYRKISIFICISQTMIPIGMIFGNTKLHQYPPVPQL